MPLFSFKCRVCKRLDRILLSPEEAEQPVFCRGEGCSGKLKRIPKAPTTVVKETVDNGIMARRVEIYPDVKEVMKERNETDYRHIKETIHVK